MMEILGEFDNESPLYVSFCQRISPEDFEKQSRIYTKEALQNLFREIDQNPRICEPILQKKKQRAKEEAGLASYLKAKLSSLFKHTTPARMEEVREEAERLKREMRKARNYALAAKRAPSWPLERREWTTRPRRPDSASQARLHAATTVPPMPKIFGPYPTQAERCAGVVDADSKLPQPGLLPVNQKSMVDHHPLMLNPGGRHPSFLGSNSAHWWKGSHFPRATASFATEPLQSGSASRPAPGSNPPAPSGPRTSDGEEEEDNRNKNGKPGADSRPPAA